MDPEQGDQQGVLLYYKLGSIHDAEAVKAWFISICTPVLLVGRVRIAPGGVNVVVGGKMAALQAHIQAVSQDPFFQGTDFKLAPSGGAVDPSWAAQFGFQSLTVRLVQELVSTELDEKPPISEAGLHLSPHQFHSLLQDGGSKTVLLDARNLYETRIGRFCPPAGLPCFDPAVRRYSCLPGWIDSNLDKLRHKRILMYCTGGIRCEMASAYLRTKGDAFQDVMQLSGGIQRYLEAFPSGGFFRGKNFVFDHRMAVASLDETVLGSCLLCASACDDYSGRWRCSSCRMLVLLCSACREEQGRGELVCELCRGKPRLRILCLHGFRQSGSGFKGRTNALRKKLRHVADFVFVDAPHEICKSRFGWLVRPAGEEEVGGLDADQYKMQTAGWEKSWEMLQMVFKEEGPFDGVLGFSQGAAVAAVAASLRCKQVVDFKFVICCSGYVCSALDPSSSSPIQCPSLHVFGEGKVGHDRQISPSESLRLASTFDSHSSVILQHEFGHLIPAKPNHVQVFLTFLNQF